MLMRTVLAASLCLAAACAHRMPNHLPWVAPDGRDGWTTQCNNWDQTIANCINSAQIICGGEFEEIARHEELAQVGGAWRMGSSSYPVRRLEYVCKTPPEAQPPRRF